MTSGDPCASMSVFAHPISQRYVLLLPFLARSAFSCVCLIFGSQAVCGDHSILDSLSTALFWFRSILVMIYKAGVGLPLQAIFRPEHVTILCKQRHEKRISIHTRSRWLELTCETHCRGCPPASASNTPDGGSVGGECIDLWLGRSPRTPRSRGRRAA